MRNNSLSQLTADLTADLTTNKISISEEEMKLVVNAHVQKEWTDNEPLDVKGSLKVGFFCAQLASDGNCDIGVVFLDAGIPTAAILAAASFAKAVRHLSLVEKDRYYKLLCVATTEETFYPDVVVGKDYTEFESTSVDSEIISNVYPRPKPDK